MIIIRISSKHLCGFFILRVYFLVGHFRRGGYTVGLCLDMERWPSGRRRSPAKGVWDQKFHRGFESLSLRQSVQNGSKQVLASETLEKIAT